MKSIPSSTARWVSCFDESFKRYAERPFSVCMEQLDDATASSTSCRRPLGAWLQSLGLEPGARVAIMLPNVPQFAVTMAAVLRAGYTCVNVNPLYTARELEHQLKDSGATAIVILENFATTLGAGDRADRRSSMSCVTSMGDLLGGMYGALDHLRRAPPREDGAALQARRWRTGARSRRSRTRSRPGAAARWRPTRSTLDSIAFLQYTGGTTGLSKGAVLTHRNIVAATLQAEAWFTPALARVGDLAKVNSIAALPLYHIFALTLCLLAIRQGSHLTLIPNPRDIGKFIAVLKKRPFHMLPAVNTLFNAPAGAPGVQERRLLAAVRLAGRRHGRLRRHGARSGSRSPAAR